MAGVELATGYVTLAAETSQISKQIGSMFKGADTVASKAGRDMGQAMAKSFEQANAVDLDSMRKEVETAEQKITAAVERSASKQEDAKRKVEIAQAKVNETTEKYGTSSSQALSAVDRLRTAEQKLEAASMAARSEQAKLTAELDQTKAAFREAERAAETAAEGTTTAFRGVGDRIKSALQGDFKGAFGGVRGDAASAANGVEQEFTAAGDEAGEGFSDGFVEKVKGLTGAVAGLGIGLSMAEGITSGMERERLGDRVAAQLNLAGPQAETAGRVAGNLYAGAWGESLDETHDAVAAVMSSLPGMMDAPASAIEGITAKAMDLTTAFDVDMNEAVGAVGVMMRNGLAKDADQAFDLMVGSLQKVPAGFRDELFPAITEYGKHFEGLGMDGATAMGLLMRGAENGVIGVDKMGDAVKEFQIRSTDMSKATGEAYDTIGLDMGEMTTELLAGGDRAETAFGQIIHGLQGIEDPAAQSAAALALFGTPLEDLSVSEIPNFLGAMDPAGDAFDDMAGAAERMGTTLNDNAATNLESFKRSIGQGFTNVVGTAAGFVLDLGSAFQPVLDFLRTTAPMWGPFAAGIGLAATAYGLYAVGTWAATAAQTAFSGALWATVAAVAPWIVGIGMVVGAVIYAWNHFDWFREGVLTVWANIKTAIASAVTWFQTTAVPWIQTALAVAGAAFTWLWRNVISPVWNGIVSVIAWAWNGFIRPVFEELVRFVREIIAPAALWLWHNIIGPAFRGISTAIRWAWNNVIKPVFQALWTFIKTVLAPVIGWLWRTIVAPYFRSIGAVIQFVWENVIRVAFRSLEWFLKNVLGPAITWLWKNVAKPAFEGIGNVVKWAWDNVIRPKFDSLKTGVGLVADAFKRAREGIAKAWDGIRKAVADPVNMVITKVINPFIGGYNRLNNFWDGDNLDPLNEIKGYARGGVLPGYQAQKRDDMLVPMRAGEGVLVPEAVRGIGAEAIHSLNAAANKGGVSAARSAWAGMHEPQYAGPGTRVYGSKTSFSNPLQTMIAKYGELVFRGVGALHPNWQLSQSAKAWDKASGVGVSFQRGGGYRGSPTVDINERSLPPGIAGMYYNNSQISLSPGARALGTPSAAKVVAVHEMGHALGLPHSHRGEGGNGAFSIMNYDTMYRSGGLPTAADVAALQAIYPGGTGKVMAAGSGDVVGVGGWLAEQLKKIITAPIDMAKKAFAGNKFVQMPLGIADRFVSDAIDFALGGTGEGTGGGEGKVSEWMTQALKMKGLFSEANLASGVRRAMQESGGDPRAVNNWDINALNGDPSKGLMQTISATFRQFMEPGHGDIWNPLDNILASINYTLNRYGSLRAGWDRAGGYAMGGIVGETPKLFDGGGWLTEGVQLIDHQRAKPDAVLTNEQFRDFHALASTVQDGERGAPLVGVLQALDVDDAMRKLYQTQKKEEFLYATS